MTVEAYIDQFPAAVKERLLAMREIVHTRVPEAEESFSYGMPAYMLYGKPLVYFAGYDKHIGLYATPTGHAAFKKELAPYKQGKGSVQFPLDQPLPLNLVEKIVLFRAAEVTASVN
ncbi:DUF1801 domain-containing protein [Candidatus Saccharibacteria bacterium]|nr:MAG: DUF1801 domain-containing protein [Candidatus Saccharibacteria bacterium]